MAPRGRQHIKNKMVGSTRMDAALDAMRQLGFEKRLVRKTVEELLDVYDGTQGWPFIEEASYSLLIETILSKQQSSAADYKKKDEDSLQDNERRACVTETSSAATPITGITDVGSSGLVAQETVLHASDDLDSASQTNDQDSALLGNIETDVKDSAMQVDRGGHGQGISLGSKNKLKPADNPRGSNYSTLVSNVASTSAKTPMNQSSEAFHHIPCLRHRRYRGWIGIDDNVEHIHFPLPPLSKQMKKLSGKCEAPHNGSRRREHIHFPLPPLSKQMKKLTGECEAPQNGSRRRGKSRWDEKPDGM